MDSTVFYDLLSAPHKADLLSEDLHQLVKDYPWFTNGRILYSKSLQLNHDGEFDEQLHKTSVYTPNREVLYNLIVSEPKNELEEDTSKIFSINKEGIEEIGTTPESIKKHSPEEDWSALKEEKIVFKLVEDDQAKKKENIGGTISSKIKTDASTDLEEKNVDEKEIFEDKTAIEKPSKPRVIDEIEKEILAGAVSRVIEKEVEEQLPELTFVEEPLTAEETEEKPEEEISFSSFTSMILKRAREVHYVKDKQVLKEKRAEITHTSSAEEPQESLKEKKKRLLDKFIALSPKISPGKLDDYQGVNLGEESLKESDFFITETMAKIYAQQGKIGKAKKTYQLLSLKYPEKSVYFAARIKNLDKK